MKVIGKIAAILVLLYLAVCILVYFIQERLLFFPTKLPADYVFSFREPYEERYIRMNDGVMLHGLLFKTNTSKGLVFYLHGNGGALDGWGEVAATYTRLGYDVFIFDYRGYGKSGGKISSEKQFYEDAQTVYDSIKQFYPEQRITLLGYSVGTGTAAMLAATNHPRRLILQAPYYSMTDMAKHHYAFLPSFLLRYTFPTYQYLERTKVPVTIFHGDQDEVIYYGSSAVKLKPYLKAGDTLITLHGQGHNGMTDNPDYRAALVKVLE
ncbi:alpha/beta hydrolase [Chitinophaga sp. 22321]|uniref:Alpha/beta fold hydrolase n=1 Tax=Chitinophaga hostae TaxID=2831022 RepID=A0ABS5JAD0_9BACT|nr:alpha/beta fold hydrolase [Chitinophaga hostae]MBS0032167.1 alpha/beta fold hydrolase [Chitinophaga hostae]